MFFCVICFIVPCALADDPDASWDLEFDSYVHQLYDDGLISDDALELYENGGDISDYLPTDHAYVNDLDVERNSNNLYLEESKEVVSVDNSSENGLAKLQAIPGSGSAYSDPTLISVEYAPDPEQGSLMEVIYNLIGKPVVAYHYRWQSNSTQAYNVYAVEHLDYDANWLASLALLMIVIFCIFKAGGALLSKQ